ncbi:MAG TPA: alanine--tRNA ligase [Fimbriimonadaceae bacterium]|nr:alanine--tRNA ligase [Fimbriimonadaceae bacterium]
MTVRELREKYLRFFESKGHRQYPSGSLIPYDVTGRLDESLLFNGAGMVQFKPYFRGVAQPPNRRLTTAQKCVRTGDIESVGDLTHLTFFEMLGNFSFGDYFKKEAVALSWEFITSPEWLNLDPRRVSFTVFEEDDEAYGYWAEHVALAGIDPETRIFRLGEDTNYWPAGAFSSGPPGPCGPNSEMFYWTQGEPPSGPYSRGDWLRDEAASRWLEFWNDVFIQFEWQGELRNPDRPAEGFVKTGMPPLPFQSIDTGMGLERTATVLGGLKSLYDTDVFQPILRKIEEVGSPSSVSSRRESAGDALLGSRETEEGGRGVEEVAYRYGSDPEKDVATRIIADHIRTAVFCIADGVLPGNTGRGYVLRRLIRRAVLKGQRALGIEQPFFHRVFEGVLESMGDHYRELHDRREVIAETLRNEEALFRRTLTSGSDVLQRELSLLQKSGANELPGDIAFRLYDTYGFPLEVTKELCEEAGIAVDEMGYEQALIEAQERSRAGSERESVYGGVQGAGLDATATLFRGYDDTRTVSVVVGAVVVPEPPSPTPSSSGTNHPQEEGARTHLAIALDQTPFYAESGGQTSDTGTIEGAGFAGRVLDVIKQHGVFVHEVEPVRLPVVLEGQSPEEARQIVQQSLQGLEVEAQIDVNRRMRIRRNHTATHLLHAALRQVLGKHVTQAGSYVGPDHLRFDFTHGKPMTAEEVARVEFIVNEEALKNTPVTTYVDLPIEEARARGAMALFGEKYGDRVRMVEIGDFSRELCGGTHLRATGEVGLFKITSESSAASGVRRIEAVTGEGAYAWVLEQTGAYYEAAARLKSAPKDVLAAIDRLHEQVREERRKREKAETALARGESGGGNETQEIKGVFLWTRKFENVDQKIAAAAVDDAVAQNKDIVALGAIAGDRVQLICKVGTEAAAKGAHAGNLIKQVAPIVGGGGGGRAEFATAGGKDASKVDEALAAAAGFLAEML